MLISITAFVSYLLPILGAARAEIIAPNCPDPSLSWSLNSLQQSPCFVGASLVAVCTGSFTVSLTNWYSDTIFYGTSGADAVSSPCVCNTVVYSLMSACGMCQRAATWSNYSLWLTNCSNPTGGIFPRPIPDGTRVPYWAYLTSYIVDSGSWNLTAAEAAGDSPEVTGMPTISGTSQSTSPTTSGSGSLSTFSPTASRSGSSSTFSHTASGSGSSSTSTPTSTSHTSSNRGAIEGGVVGGVVGGILISGVVVWFVRRRRARCAPSTTDTKRETEHPVPYTLSIKTPKLYDPSDPTTYPRTEDLSLSSQHLGTTSHLQPSHVGYSGLPEV